MPSSGTSHARIYFSDHFEVSPETLEEHGAFDVSLIGDLPLFVDPFLLFNSEKPEYQRLHDGIIEYMRFLRDMSRDEALGPGLIGAWFTFPEVRQNWLGYSETGNRGHGLGADFASALHRNLSGVFADFGRETVTQSSHIEKLCLIRDGVGRDNISDFTTNLIMDYLAEYTQVFAIHNLPAEAVARFTVRRAKFDYRTRSWAAKAYVLPMFGRDFVLLTPKDILTKDETWINRPELLDRFTVIAEALPNLELRAQVNQYLVRVLPADPKATQEEIRSAIADTAEHFPQVLDYYIRNKEEHGEQAVSASALRVEEVQTRFVEQIRRLVTDLLTPSGFYDVAGNTWEEARQRVLFMKDVIENKGGYALFYVKGEPLRRESDLQLLYRFTWFATSLDLSREVNDGRGPADFKLSRGAGDKVLVEFKLASNKRLEQNLAGQTVAYEAASDATHPSLKPIMYFTESEQQRVLRILDRLDLTDSENVILIDARDDNKPSGSRA